MGKSTFNTPLNSHFIKYDTMKFAVVNGYIEQVSGMLLSQYIDSDGQIVSNRTILTREEMIPDSNISSDDDNWMDGLHFFKNFPNLTMEDIHKTICSTKGVRSIYESFDDLNKLGCIVPIVNEDLTITVYDHKDTYGLFCKELKSIKLNKGWIPSSLEILYSIQSFLKRRIVLESSEVCPVDKNTLEMMNQILENQRKNLVFTDGILSENKAYNDGVYTYYTNGVTIEMTREEFTKKFPDAYEVLG